MDERYEILLNDMLNKAIEHGFKPKDLAWRMSQRTYNAINGWALMGLHPQTIYMIREIPVVINNEMGSDINLGPRDQMESHDT